MSLHEKAKFGSDSSSSGEDCVDGLNVCLLKKETSCTLASQASSNQKDLVDTCQNTPDVKSIPIILSPYKTEAPREESFGAELQSWKDGDYLRHYVLNVQPKGIAAQLLLKENDELLLINKTPIVKLSQQNVLELFKTIHVNEDIVMIFQRCIKETDNNKYQFENVKVMAQLEEIAWDEVDFPDSGSTEDEELFNIKGSVQKFHSSYSDSPNSTDKIQVLRCSLPERKLIKSFTKETYLTLQEHTPKLSNRKRQQCIHECNINKFHSMDALKKSVNGYVYCISQKSQNITRCLAVGLDNNITIKEYEEHEKVNQGSIPKEIAFKPHYHDSSLVMRSFETYCSPEQTSEETTKHLYIACHDNSVMIEEITTPPAKVDHIKFRLYDP